MKCEGLVHIFNAFENKCKGLFHIFNAFAFE